jgi:hypothetical protein
MDGKGSGNRRTGKVLGGLRQDRLGDVHHPPGRARVMMHRRGLPKQKAYTGPSYSASDARCG